MGRGPNLMPEAHLQHEFAAMGTPCVLQLHGATESALRDLACQLVAEVQRLEAKYSRYRDDSYLSAINRVAAQGGTVAVDEETRELLNYAAACHAQSGGLFDITAGALARVWRRGRDSLPHQAEIDASLRHVGWHRLRWTGEHLVFPEPGMQLDFGGIVKEYAADRLVSLSRASGVNHGFVNLGGDLAVIGPQPDGQPWSVGIRHPTEPGALIESVDIGRGALATSGDYERCLIIGGRRYGHIISPITGWPSNWLASVTVWAPLCVVAGSATTIAMLKDADGPGWLQGLGLPARWVAVDGSVGGHLGQAP